MNFPFSVLTMSAFVAVQPSYLTGIDVLSPIRLARKRKYEIQSVNPCICVSEALGYS